ncbi:MAG: cytochrome c [Bacteroidales bacterium]|nr:cytochrome c [Bacteroidales bacterium]
MKKYSAIIAVFAAAFMLMAFGQDEEKEGNPWEIPEKYKKMDNPVSMDNKELMMVGKSLYNKNCKSCHGSNGEGDGPMARRLKAPMEDFTSCDFKKHNDGELYYMSIIGRDEMPNYEKKIRNKEDRWALINYVKSLNECEEE